MAAATGDLFVRLIVGLDGFTFLRKGTVTPGVRTRRSRIMAVMAINALEINMWAHHTYTQMTFGIILKMALHA
jgi:hypothetical protein